MKLNISKIYKPAIFVAILVPLLFILCANFAINRATAGQLYEEVSAVPPNNVALLLGTSKFRHNGRINDYFENRIRATVQLYKAGKIKNVVISGDNSRKDYNEPLDMKNELVKRGIPESRIYPDYAGFRTYDSVFRMKAIFGQSRFTIISQEFHNQRALYIANGLHLDAIAFNAGDVEAYWGLKTQMREKLARVKMFFDLMVDKKPKFMGEKIVIRS